MVEKHNSWGVFKVAKGETVWDPFSVVYIGQYEVVHESFVQRHQNDLVAFCDVILDDFETMQVDVKSLHSVAHSLVKHVD